MRCRTCGTEIDFVRLVSGRSIPVEVKRRTVITDAGKVVRGRETHFQYCAQADKWRVKEVKWQD